MVFNQKPSKLIMLIANSSKNTQVNWHFNTKGYAGSEKTFSILI